MTRDVTEKIKDFNDRLVKENLHTQQSDIVSDALRQLFIRYKREMNIEDVRKITKKAYEKAGKSLAEEVEVLREETG